MRRAIPIVLGLAFLGGCASHYRVTDATSGKRYYTKSVQENRRAGSVSFKDEKTGADVSLNSADVKKISKREYKDAIKN